MRQRHECDGSQVAAAAMKEVMKRVIGVPSCFLRVKAQHLLFTTTFTLNIFLYKLGFHDPKSRAQDVIFLLLP